MNKRTYNTLLKNIRNSLPENQKQSFDIQFTAKQKNPTLAFILSFFLGIFGIDRMYVGRIGLGILKLLTLGALCVWSTIDWFLIIGATRKKNIKIAQETKALLTQDISNHGSNN